MLIENVLQRIQDARPDPVRLEANEMDLFEPWWEVERRAPVKWFAARQAAREGRPDVEGEWRRHLQYVLDYNRRLGLADPPARPADLGDGDAGGAPLPTPAVDKQAAALPTDVGNGVKGDPAAASVPDEAMLSYADLARIWGVGLERLRGRLRRWQENHPAADGWQEVPDRTQREAGHLYRVGAVRPILDRLVASSKTSSKRPA